MKIRWHGHSCFEISNDITIVTDPHDGKSIGIKPPAVKADIVLISHEHSDHNCIQSIKGGNIKVVKAPGTKKIEDTIITGIKTYHDDSHGTKRGENIVFGFNIEGISFCHLGDLGHVITAEDVKKLMPIHILFIPVGGAFTADSVSAWEIIKALKPKIVIPMHYKVGGLLLPLQSPEEFLKNAKAMHINKVGNEIDFEKEDLPDNTEIWFFTL